MPPRSKTPRTPTRKRARPRAVPISIGDALIASARLRPRTAAAREAILALLGFESARALPSTTPIGPWKPHERPPVVPPPIAPPVEPLRPDMTTLQPPTLDGSPVTKEPLGKITFERPAWAALQQDPFKPAAGAADSQPPPPLFARTHVRAILGAMLATWRDGTRVDIERIVAIFGAGGRIDRLPYRPEQTLRRGAQVLVNRAEAMNPFAGDVTHILADLARLFGRAHLDVLEFSHCPGRGVRSPGARRRRPWRAPTRGVPALVVSDLGLTGPIDDEDFAGQGEWRRFARAARDAGTPLVALVPFGPERWPAALARAIPFVHWSEDTSVRQVVKAVREARRLEEGRT